MSKNKILCAAKREEKTQNYKKISFIFATMVAENEGKTF